MSPRRIAIVWRNGPEAGTLRVLNGTLQRLRVSGPGGSVRGARFRTGRGAARLTAAVGNAVLHAESNATLVEVATVRHPFSFFLRDVSTAWPILLPEAGVAVTEASDPRPYAAIEADIRSRELRTELDRWQDRPEETFEAAAANTRTLRCQTWLGLSRDYRIFATGFVDEGTDAGYQWSTERWNWIEPRFHCEGAALPENENKHVRYEYMFGRGFGCTYRLERRLADGCLPILQALHVDGHIHYHLTQFATLERQALATRAVRGTHYLVASPGMVTDAQKREHERLLPDERDREEQTVLYCRIEAVNTSPAPAYAWFKTPAPSGGARILDTDGFGKFTKSGRVFAVCTLDGRPLAQEEIGVLVAPGATAVFEFRIPHRPIPRDRAIRLARESFAKRLAGCRAYWQGKLASATRISVPERRIDEMIRAGLIHLDLITYGLEPRGTVAPTIGVYSPIGSESAPIILFFESMGWHDLARRAIQYFFDKQHADGFMQNFGGYMLETGCVLWLAGEHFRYTRDRRWLRAILPGLLKACAHQVAWRGRNKRPELRGKGYGLIEGKVGDPEDPFRQYLLNGYAAAGLARAAELLREARHPEAAGYAREAAGWIRDLRAGLAGSLARGPVVPLGNGTWGSTTAPWADATHGPLCLYAEPGKWFTHGAFQPRDSVVGPLWLTYLGILDPDDPVTTRLLQYHARLMCERNVAFCQPYYSRHPEVHLARGEVKAFLKTYYNCMAAHADRETYTFWEHFFHASPHKTHEEAWFLMATRWMLWREDGDTLALLSGIPRAWMKNGQTVSVRHGASHFGPVSFEARSAADGGSIEASVACPSSRGPATVVFRLPHPEKRTPVRVQGGHYDAAAETVTIRPFRKAARVRVEFQRV